METLSMDVFDCEVPEVAFVGFAADGNTVIAYPGGNCVVINSEGDTIDATWGNNITVNIDFTR